VADHPDDTRPDEIQRRVPDERPRSAVTVADEAFHDAGDQEPTVERQPRGRDRTTPTDGDHLNDPAELKEEAFHEPTGQVQRRAPEIASTATGTVAERKPFDFDPEVWSKVPEYRPENRKVDGILVTPDGGERSLRSGYDGPSADLPKPRTGTGMNNHNVSHVEAHAAATMRLNGTRDAALYINREPCPGQVGCDRNLPRMLPPDATLTLYGPDGFSKVYRGLPAEERRA
jgi:CubicO group peptidase (beta-lactamase class C family)